MKKCKHCLKKTKECDRCEIPLYSRSVICSNKEFHYCNTECYLKATGAVHTDLYEDGK